MDWIQFKVTAPAENLEDVSAVMSMIDPMLRIDDYRDLEEGVNAMYGELIDEELMRADRTKAAVSFYISDPKKLHDSEMFIRERLNFLGIPFEISYESVKEEDWANAWRKYYHPIRTGEHLVIVPAWQDYEASDGDVIVRMEPGMAFGTGTHETTRLCAALIELHMPKGGDVLDIGTGSGILAIAESKLGAGHVYACDIDAAAVDVAKRNCADNGVTNVVCEQADLLTGKGHEDRQYDFASANIVSDILIRLAPQARKYIKPDGKIVMSGIISSRADDVISAMEDGGFAVADAMTENDWQAFCFKRIR